MMWWLPGLAMAQSTGDSWPHAASGLGALWADKIGLTCRVQPRSHPACAVRAWLDEHPDWVQRHVPLDVPLVLLRVETADVPPIAAPVVTVWPRGAERSEVEGPAVVADAGLTEALSGGVTHLLMRGTTLLWADRGLDPWVVAVLGGVGSAELPETDALAERRIHQARRAIEQVAADAVLQAQAPQTRHRGSLASQVRHVQLATGRMRRADGYRPPVEDAWPLCRWIRRQSYAHVADYSVECAGVELRDRRLPPALAGWLPHDGATLIAMPPDSCSDECAAAWSEWLAPLEARTDLDIVALTERTDLGVPAHAEGTYLRHWLGYGRWGASGYALVEAGVVVKRGSKLDERVLEGLDRAEAP